MILVNLVVGIVLMFGAGELYAQYRETKDRRTFWMCIAGALISVLNLVLASKL
jgi:uncharacterized membrane protein